MDFVTKNWLLLMPLLIIQLSLQVYCLVDLVRRTRVAGGNKLIWGVVIAIGQVLGPVVYLVFGRRD